MTPTAAAMLALVALPAVAAPLGVWTGPGQNACHGRCEQEWALDRLAPDVRRDVVEAMRGAPVPVVIRDGDLLPLMTYYRDGQRAQHDAVAMLDAPEPATGWCVRGGCFVVVHGCSNWAFVSSSGVFSTPSRGVLPAIPAPFASGGYVLALLPPSRGVPLADPVTTLPGLPGASAPGSFPVEPIPPVPLPPSAWLLLSALAGLLWLRRRHA